MTQYSTLTLVPTTTYGTASGNYDGSSLLFYGNAQPAANYYGGQGSIQTITYRVTDFVGRVTIEATLEDLKDTARWFEVSTYGDGSTILNDYHPVNIIGNFTWLRARVENFEQGTIDIVSVSY
jgi:hypothetical protein